MPFLDNGAYFANNKVLNQVLYIAYIVELPKDKTSLNSNAPDKITKGN